MTPAISNFLSNDLRAVNQTTRQSVRWFTRRIRIIGFTGEFVNGAVFSNGAFTSTDEFDRTRLS
jgi:hypothetical protein